MRVKIEDVARRAGVSTATVSLALNGNAKINAQTRDRIEAVAKELGYRPNPYAKRLAMRKSRQIGLIVPDIENIYYSALAQHALNELLTSGYALTISTSMNSPQMERRIVSDMIGNCVEGLLIAPVEKPNGDVSYLDRLDGAGIPYLFVTSRYPQLERPGVMCDLYAGMKQLLATLHAHGYRRMAMLSGSSDVYCFDLRDNAYRDFLREQGLEERRIEHLNGVRYDDSYRFVQHMDVEGVEAIVCVNDMMALGAINALSERGLRVPEDIAVAGFDDSIFSRVSPVALTTVRQDVHGMAVRAAKWILDLARDGAEAEESLRPIPCEVIVRRSTGRLA